MIRLIDLVVVLVVCEGQKRRERWRKTRCLPVGNGRWFPVERWWVVISDGENGERDFSFRILRSVYMCIN